MSVASTMFRWTAAATGLGLVAGGAWACAEVVVVGVEAANAARVTMGLFFLIVGIPLLVLPVLVGSGAIADPARPWVAPLMRLAAEHGQQVQSDPALGVWFDIVHSGPRFSVFIDARAQVLRLDSPRAVRHGVVVVRRGDALVGDAAAWSEAARGASWSMHTEVAADGAPLAQSRDLARALDNFFAFRGARQVVLGGNGLSLQLRLPPPDAAPAAIRSALDVARTIWHATAG